MSRLYILVGFPGSGKSTYAEWMKMGSDILVIHSSDNIRKELFGDAENQSNPDRVFDTLYRRAQVDLSIGKDVIIDSTNLNKKKRISLLKYFKDAFPFLETIAVFVDTPIEDCKRNNMRRSRIVPDYVYDRMVHEFDPPALDEGFSQVIQVRVQLDGLKVKSGCRGNNLNEIEFTGVFFDHDLLYTLIENKIKRVGSAKEVTHPHVTFQYKPKWLPLDLFGKNTDFRVIGYANDGFNEGLQVEIESGDRRIKKLFQEISIPHITLSVNQNGNAVNTRYLQFEPITPFIVRGTFGGCTYGDEVIDNQEINL